MSNFPKSPTSISGTSIQTVLTQTNLTLRSILKNNWPKELDRHIDKEIYTLSKNKKIKWSDISKCWNHEYEESKRSIFKLNFFYARLYYLCASHAHEKGKIDDTWIFLFHSIHLIGFLEGYKHQKEEKQFNEKRASDGGKEKASKINKIKGKISEILTKPPTKGWGSESSIAEHILNDQEFKDFIASIKAEETIKDLKDFIASEVALNAQNQKILKNIRSKTKAARNTES
ncbi:hypothetical protein [Geopseudomonas aromaticivorans]